MMFEEFARAHGLIMNGLQYDKWVRVPTVDHPHKKNGAYIFNGDSGAVQNWATMEKPQTWFAEGKIASAPQIRQKILASNQESLAKARRAMEKAAWILEQTELGCHPYLESKGFPEELGNIWEKDGARILVIPMRINGDLMGVQLINDQGEKKFLQGQTTKGASFRMGTGGIGIFCEGYATGLSVREAMRATNIQHSIYICFSASNLENIARSTQGNGIVIADNDTNHVGQQTAVKTGKPYWLSPTVGEDFNDYHRRVGNFKSSQELKSLILKTKGLRVS